MVHHTNHDKEYTCLLKGKKKYTLLFFICFKKFDQVARKCLAWLCTSWGRLPGSEGGWAARGSARGWSGPGYCYSKPLPIRLQSPVLQPRCPPAPPPAQEPTDPVPVNQELVSPKHGRARGGLWGHLVLAGSSKLWQQIEAGGQRHCCPDFFSFWKLKLVRLFSFLCF